MHSTSCLWSHKIPHKGGPGVTRSDLLVINRIDLAPHVGASRDVMARDARPMRSNRPFVFMNLKRGAGLDETVAWIRRDLVHEIRSSIDWECQRDRSPRDVERDRAGSLSPVSSHAAVNHGDCARAREVI